ncbi:hypothetical protein [Nonomuraea sp. SBT364]|uniref:hypothetical protein n=1 Tax=Nonomuraea sp. SBT364 TaxID=1580530 RepID=UPI00066A3511|nr:hypothetical protein [Nonomuraea sp. SBT364]
MTPDQTAAKAAGLEHPLLAPLGADGRLRLANEDLPDFLGLLSVDLKEALLLLGLCDQCCTGGLLGFEVASQIFHQGSRLGEGVADAAASPSQGLAWVLVGLA